MSPHIFRAPPLSRCSRRGFAVDKLHPQARVKHASVIPNTAQKSHQPDCHGDLDLGPDWRFASTGRRLPGKTGTGADTNQPAYSRAQHELCG